MRSRQSVPTAVLATVLRSVGVGPRPPSMSATLPGIVVHPVGPLVYRVASLRPTRAKLAALGVLLGCLALLALAAWLRPDERGLGTHEQLGFPPCSFVLLLGYPCPTCGMTTAFAHTVRGELYAALRAQPVGLAAALATMVGACAALSVLVTGKVWMVNWCRVSPGWIVGGCILMILGGWAYKLACAFART